MKFISDIFAAGSRIAAAMHKIADSLFRLSSIADKAGDELESRLAPTHTPLLTAPVSPTDDTLDLPPTVDAGRRNGRVAKAK